MIVGVSVCELHIPHAQSLKDKRRVVRRLIDRLYAKYRVSISETDHHDLHQRAEIGLAAVGRSEREIEHLLEDVRRLIESDPEIVLTHWSPDYLEGAP